MLNTGVQLHPVGSLCRRNQLCLGKYTGNAFLHDRGNRPAPSLTGSRAMSAWMQERVLKLKYMEMETDHWGMIPLVLPGIFTIF